MIKYKTNLYKENQIFTVKKFKTREAWLANRFYGIGGSEASSVISANPYKTNQELFKEKKGLTKAEDISDKPAVRYGKESEEFIRRIYQLDTQDKYYVNYLDNVSLVNRQNPFMLYSPDGLLEEIGTGRKGILEIKTTTILMSKQSESWKDNIPQNYYIQVLHGLNVTGFDFVELRALLKYNDGYSALKTYHIERKDVLEDLEYLQQEIINFWNNNILKNIEPNIKFFL